MRWLSLSTGVKVFVLNTSWSYQVKIIKYFSMFSGIGGFELGIQRAYSDRRQTEKSSMDGRATANTPLNKWVGEYATCIGYSEIDKYAIKVYERNFSGENSRVARKRKCDCSSQGRQETLDSERGGVPQVNRDMHHSPDCSYTESNNNGGHKNYGDATTIKAEKLPDFDLLVGGFPCQAFSVAGKRQGFNDTRGTLFFDIARILSEKRPRHLVLENVKGLLSHDQGKTFQTILGVLSDLGYRVEWQILNSKNFGVPQNRERIIIIGHLGDGCRGQVFPIRQDGTRITQGQSTVSGEIQANTKGINQPNIDKQILQDGKDRPIHQLNQPTHSNDRVYGTDGVSPTLNTMQGGNRQPFIAAQRGRGNPPKQTLEPQTEDKTNSITSVAKDNLVIDKPRIRRLTPKECERLQGFPDDWTKYGVGEEPISDTQRYKMCGNAVTTNVIQAVMRGLYENCE